MPYLNCTLFTNQDMFNILSKHPFLSYLFERLFSLRGSFELSVLLYQVWGVQPDPEAFKIHHCICCFPAVFDSDGWTRAAVSLSLREHYGAISNQPLRSAQKIEKPPPQTISWWTLESYKYCGQLRSCISPTCWKQVEMKKNVNVPMQQANAAQNGCVYIAPGEGGELSGLLPVVFSFTSDGW